MARLIYVSLASFLFALPVPATTWQILPDGSGDAPTIQAGIDSAAVGDTVELADGTYTGDGNRDIQYHGKSVIVRSASGDPATCVIDCADTSPPFDLYRGFLFVSGETSDAVLEGVKIINGYIGQFGNGNAITCSSSPTIRDCIVYGSENEHTFGGALDIHGGGAPTFDGCVIANCAAVAGGAAVVRDSASSEFVDCLFIENRAFDSQNGGAALWCTDRSSPTLIRCLFEANTTGGFGGGLRGDGDAAVTAFECVFRLNFIWGTGSGIYLAGGATAEVEACTFADNGTPFGGGTIANADSATYTADNCLLAFESNGRAVAVVPGAPVPTFRCSDIYGNDDGDWTPPIDGQLGMDDNISADPLFCDLYAGDLTVDAASPCLGMPCDRIGALGEGCETPTLIADAGSAPARALGLVVSPNPSYGDVTLRYSLPSAAPAAIRVYDIRGREVRAFEATGPKGVAKWDGADNRGERTAPGVYFIRIADGAETETKRVVMVR